MTAPLTLLEAARHGLDYARADLARMLDRQPARDDADERTILDTEADIERMEAAIQLAADNAVRDACAAANAVGPMLAEIKEGQATEARLRSELQALYLAYVRLLEAGRDRIVDNGGDCDPVDQMEEGDPALRRVRDILAETRPR